MQENTLFSEKRGRRDLALATVALITFFNPCVNIIDILPDFIGCLIIAHLLTAPSLVAPYFSEARTWAYRAAAVSALKLPTLVAVVMIRSQNTQDNDVIALVAIVFLTLELICFIPAVNNLFSALFYLGERTDAEALLRGDGKHSPDGLKALTLCFIILRGVLSALPELLRLTRAVELGDSTTVIARGSHLYPYAVLISVLITLAVGIIFLIRWTGYLKAIRSEGKFYSALASLTNECAMDELNKKQTARKSRRCGIYLTLACILTLELSFSDLGSINLIPPTLSALALTLTVFSLCSLTRVEGNLPNVAKLVAVLFCVTTLPSYILGIVFHDEYSFRDLADGGSRQARALYTAITVSSAVELLLSLATIAFTFILLRSYLDRCVIRINKDTLSRVDYDRRRTLTVKCAVLTGLMALISVGKFIQVILRSHQVAISTGGSLEHSSIIYSQSAPWFTVALAILTIISAIYAVYYIGILRDEESV